MNVFKESHLKTAEKMLAEMGKEKAIKILTDKIDALMEKEIGTLNAVDYFTLEWLDMVLSDVVTG